jgi:hypothetical protein
MRTKKRKFVRYWRISYRPRVAVLLREPSFNRHRLGNLKGVTSAGDLANQHMGNISANAKTKMMNSILWLDAQAQFKWCYSKKSDTFFRWRLNFIHLTLPTQVNHTDKFIKKLLNQFFLYAFRKCGMRTYVWKAEPQERGEIHFHITSDCFIWKTTLQNIWNGILRKHGLLGTHENPPSTRVHPTHNIKFMVQYLIKYMTKNDKHRRTISGRLWGCSRNLSQAKNIFETYEENEAFAEWKGIETYEQDYKSYDWLQVKYFDEHFFSRLPECSLLDKYRDRIQTIRKGYAPTKNFLFDENGQPMTYEKALEKNFTPANKMLYEEQLSMWKS